MSFAQTVFRESDDVLRDGSTVRIRPVQPDDEGRLLAFLSTLSDRSRAMRFFSAMGEGALAAEAHREVGNGDIFGLLALTGRDERIAGHAMYAPLNNFHAEVGFTIADDYQGRGLGTILLGHLAEAAAANSIQMFEAEVLPHNHQMIELLRESGFPVEVRVEAGQLHALFPTTLTEEALQRFEHRERIASVNALKAFFQPSSVAVIGASRSRGTIGGEIFHNLLQFGFAGPVYPVNPTTRVVQSVPAYETLEAIPGGVDLAIIAAPASAVLEAAEQCARKGVRAIVVISAGFAETGEEGRKRQEQLLEICRASGMRLIGPNCMGIINTDPGVLLDATFAPTIPPSGRIGLSSQSGALGLAIIEHASRLGLGISTFVSVGNKADISGNDLLNYWESDSKTDLILLYLESFGNPRKFSRIARRVGRKKPIIVVKSGRSRAGARAASSHTGALLASSDVSVDALFRQAGVIRTNTLEELFDVACLLANQPPPKGRRVGIVTNAGGPGILCADACESQGLEIPILGKETQAALRGFLPSHASVANPVDMIASATASDYEEAIRAVAGDPSVDSVMVIFIPPLATRAEGVAGALRRAAEQIRGEKPLLSVFMSARGVPEGLKASGVRVPSFAFPEAAAIALAQATRYGEWRQREWSAPPPLAGVRRDKAAALIASILGRGAGWLKPEEVQALLACYGVTLPEQRVVRTPEQAGTAAEELGGDVALKGLAPTLIHKTEAGAVRLRLCGALAVREAARQMQSDLGSGEVAPKSFLIQKMAAEGVEMIVGVVHDPQFGPVVACGAGGLLVEVLGDVSARLTPLTAPDAEEMIRNLKIYPLLEGFRGRPACDVRALQDILLRISAMADDLPQIAELDCNPILVHEKGATIVDVRVRVAPAIPATLLGTKRPPQG